MGFSGLLISQPMLHAAESAVVSASSDKRVNTELVTQSSKDSPTDLAKSNPVDESVSRTDFPRWPERKVEKRSSAPPPPPGPYMSTALSNDSLSGPRFDDRNKGRNSGDDTRYNRSGNTNRQDARKNSSGGSAKTMANEKFSPDVPWPGNMTRPATRWMPDDGYQFVGNNVDHAMQPAPRSQYRQMRERMNNWYGKSHSRYRPDYRVNTPRPNNSFGGDSRNRPVIPMPVQRPVPAMNRAPAINRPQQGRPHQASGSSNRPDYNYNYPPQRTPYPVRAWQ